MLLNIISLLMCEWTSSDGRV